MKVLHFAKDEQEAQVLCAFLHSHGINADNLSQSSPVSSSRFAVLVNECDFVAAKELLEDYENDRLSQDAKVVPSENVFRPSRLRLWLQVILILVVWQPVVDPFSFLVSWADSPELANYFPAQWFAETLYECAFIGMALVMMRFSGEPWSVFGIKKPIWSIDITLACVIYWIDWAAVAVGIDVADGVLVEMLGPDYHRSLLETNDWLSQTHGLAGAFGLLLFCIAIGFAEELMMRGLLLTRFEQLFHSKALSVLLSAAIFGLGHWSAGVISVVGAILTGIIFGIAFVWTRRLWPVAISHAIVDFISFLYIASPGSQ
jgi:membrane protease YdiL (CAAX protease family)